jgi:bifunctional DNA-binding transcriptional regulator/antitoxin component of YhaV-PrlF toxin-antitoxin module
MREVTAILSSKGQITIPVEVRRHLAVATGARLAFVIEDDGAVTLRVPQYPTISSLRGAAGALARPHSWCEMREIGREDALMPAVTPEE